MKRLHEPGRLDVAAFASDAGELHGGRPVRSFSRLADVVPPEAPDTGAQWRIRGALRRPNAVDPEVWLSLDAQAPVWMTCQRCLQPVEVPVHVERALRFVRGDDEAARLDAETDDDVLPLEGSIDVAELVEDELLLALPLVPRHDTCPQPLAPPPGELEEPAAESPFAALSVLKRGGGAGPL